VSVGVEQHQLLPDESRQPLQHRRGLPFQHSLCWPSLTRFSQFWNSSLSHLRYNLKVHSVGTSLLILRYWSYRLLDLKHEPVDSYQGRLDTIGEFGLVVLTMHHFIIPTYVVIYSFLTLFILLLQLAMWFSCSLFGSFEGTSPTSKLCISYSAIATCTAVHWLSVWFQPVFTILQ